MRRVRLEDMINASAEDWEKVPAGPDGARMVSVSKPLEGDLLQAARNALRHNVGLKARTKKARITMHNMSDQDQ